MTLYINDNYVNGFAFYLHTYCIVNTSKMPVIRLQRVSWYYHDAWPNSMVLIWYIISGHWKLKQWHISNKWINIQVQLLHDLTDFPHISMHNQQFSHGDFFSPCPPTPTHTSNIVCSMLFLRYHVATGTWLMVWKCYVLAGHFASARRYYHCCLRVGRTWFMLYLCQLQRKINK